MLMKKPRHRVFDYTPRFYDPRKDEKEKTKKRIGFSSQLKVKRKKRNPLVWGIFLIIILYMYLKLSGML